MNRLQKVLFAMLLLVTPVAYAQTAGIGNAISNAFRIIFDVLNQRYVQFGIVVILLIMLFYNIFNAGISRVSAFGGDGGANKYGRVVSLSLAIMATLGILFFGGTGPEGMVERILETMGWLGGIAFAVAIFGITYYNMKGSEKTWPATLISTGVAMIALGMFQESEGFFSFGTIFLVWGIIMFLFSGNRSNSDGENGNDGNNNNNNGNNTDNGTNGPGQGGFGSGPTPVTNSWGEIIPEESDSPGGSR